ncbi:hypothetical protein AAVH_40581, partial [Aphelenchoides avenae]
EKDEIIANWTPDPLAYVSRLPRKGLQDRIEWFEHNATDDLERLLEIQADEDSKNPKKAFHTRRFGIVGGLALGQRMYAHFRR